MDLSARLNEEKREEIRKGETHSWFCCVNAVRQPRQAGWLWKATLEVEECGEQNAYS